MVALTALACAILAGAPAEADERSELEKARASFLARNWTDAEERLRVLLDPKTGLRERNLISQARMYLGASLLAQGKKDDAKEVFEKLVLDDPTFDPDPLSFPGGAINMFIDVRSSLLEQIKNAQQTAARLAARIGPQWVLAWSTAVLVVAASAIIVTDQLGLGLWGTVVPLFVFMTACGFTFPCVQVLALDRHGKSAGTAQSIIGASNFGVAGLISPLVGWIARDAGITATTRGRPSGR